VVQRDAQDSSRWWFMRDDSITFAPANHLKAPKEMRRAIAHMVLDSDIKPVAGYHYTANFSKLEPVKVLPVEASSAAYIDSAPHDKLLALAGGCTLQYLTLEIAFNTYDATKHTFRLLRDSLQAGERVQLHLSHSNGGASEHESLGTLISFDLETLAERSTQDSVQLRFVSPIDTGSVFDFTYRFIR
jgi:hypothetical protein